VALEFTAGEVCKFDACFSFMNFNLLSGFDWDSIRKGSMRKIYRSTICARPLTNSIFFNKGSTKK